MANVKTPHLWIPGQGVRPLETRDKLELPYGVMQRVIEFAEMAQAHSLGLHCAKCSQDLVASNSEFDPVLTLTCGCREFWSTNSQRRRDS
jgi:hypothetical protein